MDFCDPSEARVVAGAYSHEHDSVYACESCGHPRLLHQGLLGEGVCCRMGGWPHAHVGGCECVEYVARCREALGALQSEFDRGEPVVRGICRAAGLE